MVKKIVKDSLFLAQKSVDATEDDKQVVTDLLDTLRANLDHCVGMAANMIGVKKNIIVVAAGPFQFAMINPVITGKSGAFQTEEGCLSLDGVRTCTRYKEIEGRREKSDLLRCRKRVCHWQGFKEHCPIQKGRSLLYHALP